MYRQKAVAVALMLVLIFNILAVLGGEYTPNGDEPEDEARYTPEDLEPFFGKLRGTRAGESLNVDFLSRILYGLALDVVVEGNYAYVCAGANLLIFDISNKADPQIIGSESVLTMASSIDIEGSYAYVADTYWGLQIFDISDPTNPTIVGGYDIDADPETFRFIFDVFVLGTTAYLACTDGGLIILDVTFPSAPWFLGDYTSVWIIGVTVVGATAYCVSLMDGFRIIDVSTPSTPLEIGYNDTFWGFTVNYFGGIPYVCDNQDYLYPMDVSDPTDPVALTAYPMQNPVNIYVDEPSSTGYVANSGFGLTILDMTDPSNPSEYSTTDTGDYTHGVYYDGGYAFISSESTGLFIFDVTTPTNPSITGSFFTGAGVGDVVARNEIAYVAGNSVGLVLYDVTDPTDPLLLSPPDETYSCDGVTLLGNLAYVLNRDMFMVIDVSSPADPWERGSTWLADYGDDIFLDYPFAYVAVGPSGVSIVDVSTPSSPNEEAVYNQVTNALGVHVQGDYLYIANGNDGLKIVDVTDPSNPGSSYTFPTGDTANDVYVTGDYAYVAMNESGLRIVDVSTPSSPAPTSTIDTNGYSKGVFVTGGHAYVADGPEGLRVIDVTTPSNPIEVGYYVTSGSAESVYVYNSLAYVCTFNSGLYLLDVSSFSPPQISSTVPVSNATNVNVDTSIMIDFTEVMDTNSAENAFSYTDGIGTWGAGAGTVVWSNGDMTFTFTPSTQLDYGGKYTVTMAHTAEDLDGNGLDGDGDGAGGEGPEDDYSWSFNTTPPPPTIVSHFPEDLSLDIPLNADIIVNFSQAMDTTSVENAFNYTDGVDVWVISDGTAQWTNGDTTFTFTPTDDLISEVQYGITISRLATDAQGALLDGDEDGISGEEGEDDYSWSFTTLSLPPTVESTYPQNGMTWILTDTSVILNFTKSMNKGSVQGDFSYTDGIQTWDISDGSYVWSDSDKTLTFTPFLELEFDTLYQFTILHTATDSSGNQMDSDGDGVPGETGQDDFTWSFTTIPPLPRVISSFPDDGTIELPVDVSMIINFTKAMDQASVAAAFSYTDGNTTWNSADVSLLWSNGGKTVTATPIESLENAIQYRVNISYNAMDTDGFVLDSDGDGIGGEGPEDGYGWSFSTIPIPPEVNSTFPMNGATLVNIDTSVTINFSKSMNKEDTLIALGYTDGSSSVSPSAGQVVWSNNNMTLTFTPTSNFANEKTFTFTVLSTAKDEEGAYLDSDGDGTGGEVGEDDYSFSFSTMHLPSKVVQITPNKKETMVEVNTDIVVRFSRSMDNGSVETAFSYTHENTTTNWVANDGNVQWSPDSKIMTLTPDELLDHNRVYTVTILASAEDTLGVTLDGDKDKIPEGEGIDDYTWEFTTVKQPPEVLSMEPGNNTLDVLLDPEMKIRFDRSMDTRSIEQAFSFTHSGTSETWEISDGTAVWTEASSVFTFTPDFRLDEGMVYTVTIDASGEDEDGVPFPGHSWQFTTKINSPPVLENGGVNPDPGTSDDQLTFSIVYTDTDDDEATEKILVIDQVEWRMYSADPTDKTYTDGKAYEFILELDEGEHEYYFEFSDGKNTVRFPESTNKKLNVEAASDEGGGTGFLDEEYAGVPGMICAPLGLIIIIVIVLVVVMVVRKGKRAKRMEGDAMSFQSFEPETSFQTFDDSPVTFSLPGDEPAMSFAPIDEPAMSFTAFEEASPSLDAAEPAVVQCPDCGEYLRVRAAHRPFEFPCKCGAKLVLK